MLSELLTAQQQIEQGDTTGAQACIDSLIQDYGLERLNGTAQDALLTGEAAAVFTTLYQQTRPLSSGAQAGTAP